jgi:predicted P-loop ATPase
MNYTFEQWLAGAPLPKGWDAADAVDDGWTAKEIEGFMRATVRPWEPPSPPQDTPPAPEPEKPKPEPQKPIVQVKQKVQEKPAQAEATITPISRPRESYHSDDAWKSDFVTNEEGLPKATVSKNWALMLEHHPKMQGVLAYDAFSMQVSLERRPAWEHDTGEKWVPRPLRESDFQNAVMWLESLHMTPKLTSIKPVIFLVAEKYSFDRLTEYLTGLVWDGVPRVDHFFRTYFGVDPDENSTYSQIVSRRFLISCAARALRPGCKVDTMPIIEGPQGLLKSSGVKAFAGEQFFSDELSEIGSKDAKLEMQGKWIFEIAEMHRMNAAETNAVKKFLSQSTDRFRPPYGTTVIEAMRRCVMIGTINPDGNPYLKDSTGARRFWPVTATKVDIAAIRRDRDQIWAEAVVLLNAGEPWWMQADELDIVEEQQTERTDIDVWTDAVLKSIEGRTSILLSEIIREIGIPSKDAGERHAGRIGRIMRAVGWMATRDLKGGAAVIKYVKPLEDGDVADW